MKFTDKIWFQSEAFFIHFLSTKTSGSFSMSSSSWAADIPVLQQISSKWRWPLNRSYRWRAAPGPFDEVIVDPTENPFDDVTIPFVCVDGAGVLVSGGTYTGYLWTRRRNFLRRRTLKAIKKTIKWRNIFKENVKLGKFGAFDLSSKLKCGKYFSLGCEALLQCFFVTTFS